MCDTHKELTQLDKHGTYVQNTECEYFSPKEFQFKKKK